MTENDLSNNKDILKSWICERIDRFPGAWTQEMTDWATNVIHHPCKPLKSAVNHHYDEPPIPIITGFVAALAMNPQRISANNMELQLKTVAALVATVIEAEAPCPYPPGTEPAPLTLDQFVGFMRQNSA